MTNGRCGEGDIVLRGSMYEFISVDQRIGAFLTKGGQGVADIEKTLMSADVDYKIIFKRSGGGESPESFVNGIVTEDLQQLFIHYDKSSLYKDSVMTLYDLKVVSVLLSDPNDNLVKLRAVPVKNEEW